MPKKGGNISLSSYDDIFQTDQSREEAQQERVQEIPLSELHPFKGHPFKVLDDEAMQKTVESIAQFGVMTPAIARPRPEGGYELIAGHRRHHASELAGKETMPVIVRDMDDDAATILMVDSNLQRETLLPSERAFAYKMKLEAIKHQGQRTDLTSSQVGMKLQAMDIVGQEAGDSRNQVHRYIRLTELIPELLDMVDEKKIAFNPAVEISYLKPNEQQDFLEAMDYAQSTPSLSQAQRLKKFSQEGKCSLDAMCAIMSEEKKGELDRVTIAEYAKHDRAEFVRVVQEAQSSQQTAEVRKQRTRLATAKQRVSELEVLLCKIYEDNILGKLSDSRYATLDAQYEKEQSELTAEISVLEKAVKSYEKHEKDADRFIALIDKYENFDKLTIAMLNEFIEKILVHERDRKGSIQTTQEVEIYFNFVGRFVPPAFGEVELTPEELEEIRKREERKDRLHQNYLKRKASGAQKRYEDKIKGRKKAEIEAKKAAIRAEDIAKGVFVPVSSLPQREPMKGVQSA